MFGHEFLDFLLDGIYGDKEGWTQESWSMTEEE